MSLAQLEKVIEILTARERPENPTVEDSRAGFEKMMRMIGGKTPASVQTGGRGRRSKRVGICRGSVGRHRHSLPSRRRLCDWLSQDAP